MLACLIIAFRYLIAALPVLFMWEFASIKVNIRLSQALRKRLFKTGARFAILALVVEIFEKLIHLSAYPPITHAFLAALLTAAIPEELVKFGGVYRIGRREIDEIGPGIAILLAVGISLGFAMFENVSYVETRGLGVAIARALTAVPMHAVFGLVMGSFMAIAWRDYRKTDYLALACAIFVPVGFHFAYDFVQMAHMFNPRLRWPATLLPAVIMVEGAFAMLLTRFALSGETAIYDARTATDPTGKRAGFWAFLMLILVAGVIFLARKFPGAAGLPALAVMPLVLAIDLCLTTLARIAPERNIRRGSRRFGA